MDWFRAASLVHQCADTVLLGYSAAPLSKAVHDDDKALCQATVYLSSQNRKA
jgi:hypothetical protein